MKPSIGRIVHVGTDVPGIICPAIITAVHGDTCINVTRFNADGSTTAVTSLVDCEKITGEMDWQWPPRV